MMSVFVKIRRLSFIGLLTSGLFLCMGCDESPTLKKQVTQNTPHHSQTEQPPANHDQAADGPENAIDEALLKKLLGGGMEGRDECCTDIGQIAGCWYDDAKADNVSCIPAGDGFAEDLSNCSSGQKCMKIKPGEGLCTCKDDALACGNGICTDVTGTIDGLEYPLCGPSWCNGFKVCSCWGGCEDETFGGYETPREQCQDVAAGYPGFCCEGTYPNYVNSEEQNIGSGFCDSNPTCGEIVSCSSDTDCYDGNACTANQCINGSCSSSLITDGPPSVDGSCDLGVNYSLDCAEPWCNASGECVANSINETMTCTANPQNEQLFYGNHPRTDATDISSCYTLQCTSGQCMATAVSNPDPANGILGLACTDEPNSCTDDFCINGLCNHDGAAHESEACNGDNNWCTGEKCQSGVCVADAQSDVDCSALNDQCNIASCNPADPSRVCTYHNTPKLDAVCAGDEPVNGCNNWQCQVAAGDGPIDDASDVDEKLTCTYIDSVTCSPVPCQTAVCDGSTATLAEPSLYSCVYSNVADGTACMDGNGCTAGDSCISGSCISGPSRACDSELAAQFGEFDTVCNTETCVDDPADTTEAYTCEFTPNMGADCVADADGCTLDYCTQNSAAANPANEPYICAYSGTDVNCATEVVCAESACQSNGVNNNDGTCQNTPADNTTACDDGSPCTEVDLCNGVDMGTGACEGTGDPCDAQDTLCMDYTCSPLGSPYTCNSAATGTTCCTADADCQGSANPCPSTVSIENGGCGNGVCLTSGPLAGTCGCDTVPQGDSCTDLPPTTPPSCYEGQCDASGTCMADGPLPAKNNLCSDLFIDNSGSYEIDYSSPGWIGEFSNATSHGDVLTVLGSTTCAFNNYESIGEYCDECTDGNNDGACDVSPRPQIGHAGKDLVYAFRYQDNAEGDFAKYAFEVKVHGTYDVAVYIADTIENPATDCPESFDPTGDDPDNGGFNGDVSSRMCVYPYQDGNNPPMPTVVEDECNANGNTVHGQDCCDPCCRGTDQCYHWCKRGYNFDGSSCDVCSGVGASECNGSAPYDPDTHTGSCDALWLFPDDPYDCSGDIADTAFDESVYNVSLATAVVNPKGDVTIADAWHTVFVFVDGVAGADGDFVMEVTKKRWNTSPCERVNDDGRLYDITHPGPDGMTIVGTLEGVVSSAHSGATASNDCGGYDCSATWLGTTSCHDGSSGNQFWPNTEWFKIYRTAAEGSQKYCIMTDETITGGDDLVLHWSKRRVQSAKTICDILNGYFYDDDGNTCLYNTKLDGSISGTFTAEPGWMYTPQISSYTNRNRPCDTSQGDNCAYKITVYEGDCPTVCEAESNIVDLQNTGSSFVISDDSYHDVAVGTGEITSASANSFYTSPSNGRDQVWSITNSTGADLDIQFTVDPSTGTGDPVFAVYDCALNRIDTYVDVYGGGVNESETFTLPASADPYYVVVDTWGSSTAALGGYTLYAKWGEPPTLCQPVAGTTAGTVYLSSLANPYAGTTSGQVDSYNCVSYDKEDEVWVVVNDTGSTQTVTATLTPTMGDRLALGIYSCENIYLGGRDTYGFGGAESMSASVANGDKLYIIADTSYTSWPGAYEISFIY